MSTNMQRLSTTLSNRMKKTADGAVPTTIELGTVNDDLSITPDSLREAIPKGDYMINIMLTGNQTTETADADDGDETETEETDSQTLPPSFRDICSGDRVLIAWCGNEPVVIAIVISS